MEHGGEPDLSLLPPLMMMRAPAGADRPAADMAPLTRAWGGTTASMSGRIIGGAAAGRVS